MKLFTAWLLLLSSTAQATLNVCPKMPVATATSHQFVSAITAAGATTLSQPAFTDVSGSVAASQMPALTGDVTTSAGAVAATIAASAVTAAKMSSGAAANGTVATANGSGGVSYAAASLVLSVVSKTGTYTITTSDDVVLADSTGGAFTLTLPDATTATKKHYTVIDKGGSLANAVTLATVSSQTIGGSGTTRTMYTLNEEFDLIPDGTNWQIYNHKTQTARTSFTPTFSPAIGNGTVAGYWWRDGVNVCIQDSVVFGSTSTLGANAFTLSLPTNITFDTTKVTNTSNVTNLGSAAGFISGVANYTGGVIYQSSTQVRISGPNTGDVWTGNTYPAAWNTSSYFAVTYCGPVSGWYE